MDDLTDILLSPPLILCAVILTIMLLIPLLCRTYFYILFKTLPRDVKGAVRYGKLLLHLRLDEMKNKNVAQVFEATVQKYPNKVCFYFEDQQWTFRQVDDMANRVANYFSKVDYVKGDSVALYMENRPEYVCIWLGLSKIGVVSALINFNLRLNPLQHSFNAADCKALIYGHELQDAVLEVIETGGFSGTSLYCFGHGGKTLLEYAIDLDTGIKESLGTAPVVKEPINFNDKLYYIYTSGTTGLPKAAIIKHSRFFMVAYGGHYMQGITVNDIQYTPLPLYHTAGGSLGVGQALCFGTGIVLRKKFSVSNFWKDCVKYDVTVGQYIGEICRYLISQPPSDFDNSHKVRLMYGNGLRPEIWQRFVDRFGIPIMGELYGATEGNCNLINIDGKVVSVGFLPIFLYKLLPMVLVRVDEIGEIMRDPKTGLCVRSKPGEVGELTGKISNLPTRSFETGDTFRWKGENVSTAEVESVISSIVGLKDAVVYGVDVPGSEGKAGMAAIADPDGNLDLTVLADGLTKQLPAYARPIFVRILKEIDMTGTFKLKKLDLQNDGYNIYQITDNIYYYTGSKYIPLDAALYDMILSAKMRL